MDFPPPGDGREQGGGSSIRQKGKNKKAEMDGDKNKAKKPRGGSSQGMEKLTEKEKALWTLVNELKPEKEELSHVMKMYGDRTYRSTKKAENEGYKKLADQTSTWVEGIHGMMQKMLPDTLQMIIGTVGEVKEATQRIGENQDNILKLLSGLVTAGIPENNNQGATMGVPGHAQGDGKPCEEYNLEGLQRMLDNDELPSWSTISQMIGTPNNGVICDSGASTSTVGHSNEENMRLKEKVEKMEKELQDLKNQIFKR